MELLKYLILEFLFQLYNQNNLPHSIFYASRLHHKNHVFKLNIQHFLWNWIITLHQAILNILINLSYIDPLCLDCFFFHFLPYVWLHTIDLKTFRKLFIAIMLTHFINITFHDSISTLILWCPNIYKWRIQYFIYWRWISTNEKTRAWTNEITIEPPKNIIIKHQAKNWTQKKSDN